jgi:hypothetical protein
VSVQAKTLKVLVDVGSSFSRVSLHPFDLSFGFIFMPLLCFCMLLFIGVPMWLNNGSDMSLEQDEQSKKQAGNATQYYDARIYLSFMARRRKVPFGGSCRSWLSRETLVPYINRASSTTACQWT